jgi:meso-butanediol dehydrogenase / (S,S)-butanediol dehydrogenase / diacetyl reductase
MGFLNDRVALITGAGRGIGAGIARFLACQGASVALMGRTRAPLDETLAAVSSVAPRSTVHLGDVSVEGDVDRVVNEVVSVHDRIDILVNNAGIVDEAEFLDASWGGWSSVIATNLSAVFLMTQRAARRMRTTGGGAVVNIASIDAHGSDGPYASYTAAKAGVIGLTKAAAVELAPYAIRVNSVSPGWTRTKLVEEYASPVALKHMRERFSRVPLKRLVEINEIAATVAFLVGPAASGITGTDVAVDCGMLSNLYVYETLPQ